MDIQEIKKQGLKREYKITVPVKHLKQLTEAELQEIGKDVSLPGFRKGKVPLNVIEQRYGADARKAALERAMQEASQKIFKDNKVTPAANPKFAIEQYKPDADLIFNMYFDVMPEVKLHDLKDFALDHHKVKVGNDQIQESLQKIALDHHTTAPIKKDRATKTGDVVLIDFAGELHGKNIPNATAKDYELHLGSQSFVDTFEEQLVDKKVGDRVMVHVNFPENYHGKELAGQHVHFDVLIKEIRETIPAAVDDALATRVGFKDLAHLRETVEKHLQGEFDRVARGFLKQDILDAFSERYDFDLPEQMVDMEMESIIEQLKHEHHAHAHKNCDGHHDHNDHAHEPTEAQLKDWREEYLPIAQRRVRLGLVLAEIANQNKVDVTPKELSDAILHHARNYPGQEKQVIEYFKNDENARANLRGPLLEEKVIDFIINHLPLTVKEVSYEQMNDMIRARRDEGETGPAKKGAAKKKSSKK
jgi:trigger factor